MALFDFLKICVFTDVSGMVTLDGNPVEGAKIMQAAKVSFNNDEFFGEAITNENGEFRFPAIYAKTINRFLPSANAVSQLITIEYQGNVYQAWQSVKPNYDYDGELNDIHELLGERDRSRAFPNKLSEEKRAQILPFHLICELSRKDTEVKQLGEATVVGLD